MPPNKCEFNYIDGDPLETDVICGQRLREHHQKHPANIQYIEIIQPRRTGYQSEGADKDSITKSVIKQCHVRKLRFIQQDKDGRWYLLDAKAINGKIKKTLGRKHRAKDESELQVNQQQFDEDYAKLLEHLQSLLQEKKNEQQHENVQEDDQLDENVEKPGRLDVLSGKGCDNVGNKVR